MFRWAVAIFSARETIGTLSYSVTAAIAATGDVPSVIDIIVNGKEQLADQVTEFVKSIGADKTGGNILRVWFVKAADKALAWNYYVHDIWDGSNLVFFIDGYARVLPDSLSQIATALDAAPVALAASGVPTVGRNSRALREKMLYTGGIHGSLYVLRGEILKQLRDRGFRLPIGLYRTDGVLGAVICFGLEPSKKEWDPKRIVVHPQATWTFRKLHWWRVGDLRQVLKRLFRQSQGVLENLAVREYFANQGRRPEELPRNISDLVVAWLDSYPGAARAIFLRKPLCLLAAKKLRSSKDTSCVASSPLLLAKINVSDYLGSQKDSPWLDV